MKKHCDMPKRSIKSMNIAIGMIALNETEFLEKNLIQHYYWEGANVHQIILVEGAVSEYPRTYITRNGLSTDGTGDMIKRFMKRNDPYHKVFLVRGRWKDKVEQRNQYTELINEDTDILIVIDCDEFYTKRDQKIISNTIEMYPHKDSFLVPIINLWHRPDLRVMGGYWDVPHLKIYRWQKGCRYHDNHVQLCCGERNYHTRDQFFMQIPQAKMIHYGYCRSEQFIKDKCQYYLNRGEAKTRPFYVTARGEYFEWQEGMSHLQNGVQVIPYDDELPECFVEEKEEVLCY